MHKDKNNGFNLAEPLNVEKVGERPCPIPDGLPKSLEELEEEERGRMPDSPYTRLLRTKGSFPAWFSPAPDHETDWLICVLGGLCPLSVDIVVIDMGFSSGLWGF